MDTILNIDFFILNAIDKLHTPTLDWLMLRLTDLADYGLIWILLGILLLFLPKDRKTGAKVLLSLVFSLILCNFIFKNFFCRVRPFTLQGEISLLVEAPTDWSFPSGHTSASFAAAAVLLKEKKKMGWVALAVAFLVAFSRLYLYVHYPSDVLGGAIVGICSGLLSLWSWPRLERVFQKGGKSA